MDLQVEYKNSLLGNYMILKLQDSLLSACSYKLSMLENNSIPGLLKVKRILVNEFAEFQYEIANKNPLVEEYKERKISSCELENIRKSLIIIGGYMEEYLLDAEDLILKPENIYVDTKTRSLSFCYLPGRQGDSGKEMQLLMEYILKVVDHSDDMAIRLGYKMYDITVKTNFILADLSIINFEQDIMMKEDIKKGTRENKDQNEKVMENKSKRNIKPIVIISVISIIILMVGICFVYSDLFDFLSINKYII